MHPHQATDQQDTDHHTDRQDTDRQDTAVHPDLGTDRRDTAVLPDVGSAWTSPAAPPVTTAAGSTAGTAAGAGTGYGAGAGRTPAVGRRSPDVLALTAAVVFCLVAVLGLAGTSVPGWLFGGGFVAVVLVVAGAGLLVTELRRSRT